MSESAKNLGGGAWEYRNFTIRRTSRPRRWQVTKANHPDFKESFGTFALARDRVDAFWGVQAEPEIVEPKRTVWQRVADWLFGRAA